MSSILSDHESQLDLMDSELAVELDFDIDVEQLLLGYHSQVLSFVVLHEIIRLVMQALVVFVVLEDF